MSLTPRHGPAMPRHAPDHRPGPAVARLRTVLVLAVVALLAAAACGSERTGAGGGLSLSAGDGAADTATDEPGTLVIDGGEEPGATVQPTDSTVAADGSAAEDADPAADDGGDGPDETAQAPEEEPPAPEQVEARAYPDCSGGCNYVMEGDSITFNLSQWLWPKFCTDVGAATCVNSGISGHRIDQMIETARSDVDVHLGPGDNDVLIFWGGTNDLWQKYHSTDPAEGARGAYESTKAYIAERREKGWDYVLILTHPPMNPGIVEGWEVLNELIRTNEAGADTVIDVAPDPKLADPFDPVMKSTDGVHYKDPGRQVVVEEYLIPTVQALQAG
ncbi:MAG: SGNH/GDSL hydrolase family protein [Actinomycetota bacterium]